MIIISYDEKPGIQAIGNRYPDLMPVVGEYDTISRDHEYIRHGTISLLAGIDLLTGTVHYKIFDNRRSIEFIQFLKGLDSAYPQHIVNSGLKVSNSSGIKLSTYQFPGLKPRGYVDDRYGGVPHVARFIQQRIEHQRDRQTNWI